MSDFLEDDRRLAAMHGYEAVLRMVYDGEVGKEMSLPPLNAEHLAALTPEED